MDRGGLGLGGSDHLTLELVSAAAVNAPLIKKLAGRSIPALLSAWHTADTPTAYVCPLSDQSRQRSIMVRARLRPPDMFSITFSDRIDPATVKTDNARKRSNERFATVGAKALARLHKKHPDLQSKFLEKTVAILKEEEHLARRRSLSHT